MRDRRADHTTCGVRGESAEEKTSGAIVRVDEDRGDAKEGEVERNRQGGVAVYLADVRKFEGSVCARRSGRSRLHLISMSVRSTACSPTFPFREPASAPSNSIQPSLKPSSILMRGTGFFMPCDLNSDSQVSRGTASILTGRPSRSAKVVAIS
jgi:hypothetical protein